MTSCELKRKNEPIAVQIYFHVYFSFYIFSDLFKKMPGFRSCYRLVIHVVTLLVIIPLLWIWKNFRDQMVFRAEYREPVEQEDQGGKLYSLLSSDLSKLVAIY